MILHGDCTTHILHERIPPSLFVALLRLNDGLVEGEPIVNLARKLFERFLGIIGIGFDDLPVLPATTTKQPGRHIEVIEVYEYFHSLFLRETEHLVIKSRSLRIDVPIRIDQPRPLD